MNLSDYTYPKLLNLLELKLSQQITVFMDKKFFEAQGKIEGIFSVADGRRLIVAIGDCSGEIRMGATFQVENFKSKVIGYDFPRSRGQGKYFVGVVLAEGTKPELERYIGKVVVLKSKRP